MANTNEINNKFAKIKGLIVQDKEQALQDFNRLDLELSLEKRIKIESKRRSPRIRRFVRPIPAMGFIVLVLAVLSIVIWRISVQPSKEFRLPYLEKYLSNSSRLNAVLSGDTNDLSEEVGRSNLEMNFRTVLSSLDKNLITKEEMLSNLAQGFKGMVMENNRFIFEIPEKETQSLKLENELLILRREKSFYRFFNKIFKKIEEV